MKRSRSARLAAGPLIACASLSWLSACALELAPGDESSPSQQALLAGVELENASNEKYPHWMCNEEEREAAFQAATLGRTIAGTQTMMDCVDHVMRTEWRGYGPYRGCKIDGD